MITLRKTFWQAYNYSVSLLNKEDITNTESKIVAKTIEKIETDVLKTIIFLLAKKYNSDVKSFILIKTDKELLFTYNSYFKQIVTYDIVSTYFTELQFEQMCKIIVEGVYIYD